MVEAVRPLSATDVLGALEGVVYTTDLNGVITYVSQPSWGAFAEENGAPHIASAMGLLGRSLFTAISGPTVTAVYRSIHQDIVEGRRPQLVFTYRCDAPDRERHMRMAVSGLRSGDRLVGVLYQSQLIETMRRPPIDFLATGRARPPAPNLQDVLVCSFCGDVASGALDSGRAKWVPPAAFYASVGDTPVRVVDAACPRCAAEVGG